MTNMEKIKIGLKCIIDGTVRCESCGYAIDKHGHYSCQQNCASDALALLNEQEAVEPDTDSEGICSCGNCGETVGWFPAGCSTTKKLCKFCPECGKAVKWE